MDSEREFHTEAAASTGPPVAASGSLNGHRLEPFALMRDALKALAAQTMRWVVLGMAFTLFAWSMRSPDWIRFATACAFSAVALTLVVWRERRR